MKKFESAHKKEFLDWYRADKSKLEWLAYLGQPMLYDTEAFALRKPFSELTQNEYYRWMKYIRVC